MLYGPLIEQFDFKSSGKDNTGLGRWVYMTLQGGDGIVTQIVCGYNSCNSGKHETRSSYQQQRRYFITREKDRTCLRLSFKTDLLTQLKEWRKKGDRLIVCMDVNKDIYRKSIGKSLTESEDLRMAEMVGNYTGLKIGATFFQGSKPIDGVWTTPDVAVTGGCVMPAGYGVGDHGLCVVDILTLSLIGHDPPKIVKAAARRLNTTIPKAETNHLKNRLDKAQERGDEVAEKQILAIILGEKQRRRWRKLNYGMGKSFGRSARIVSEETEGGNILEHEGKENVEEAIWAKIYNERFYLAEEAPVCNSKLKGEFG